MDELTELINPCLYHGLLIGMPHAVMPSAGYKIAIRLKSEHLNGVDVC
jgi:hypothetical protein